MKKVKYQGREVVLNDEQEKLLLEKTRVDKFLLKFLSYMVLGGWLVSGFGFNGLHEMRKSKADLLANYPKEYKEYLDAERRLEVFRNSFMSQSGGKYYYKHSSLDSSVNIKELSESLPHEDYARIIELIEKDRRVYAELEKIYSGFENYYNKKKEPIKEKVNRTFLDLSEAISFALGLSTTVTGFIFGGGAFSSYRKRRKKFLENILKEQSGGVG